MLSTGNGANEQGQIAQYLETSASRHPGEKGCALCLQGQHPWSEASPALTSTRRLHRKHLETYLMEHPIIRPAGLIRRSLWVEGCWGVVLGSEGLLSPPRRPGTQSSTRWVCTYWCLKIQDSSVASVNPRQGTRGLPPATETTAVTIIPPRLRYNKTNRRNTRIFRCDHCVQVTLEGVFWNWLLEAGGRRVWTMIFILFLGIPPGAEKYIISGLLRNQGLSCSAQSKLSSHLRNTRHCPRNQLPARQMIEQV